jgi:hypothetical protein
MDDTKLRHGSEPPPSAAILPSRDASRASMESDAVVVKIKSLIAFPEGVQGPFCKNWILL